MTTEPLTPPASLHDDLVDRLRKSEELYARVFLGNPVAMSITNADSGRLTEINSAFASLLGYSRFELVGRTSAELGLWPDRSRREDIGARLRAGEELPLMPGKVRGKDGSEIAVLVAFRLLQVDHSPAVLSVLIPAPAD